MPIKYLKHQADVCTGCRACESACATAFFKAEDRAKARIQVENGVANVCSQCGECIKVCAEEALYRSATGVVMVDQKKCVGCLLCVGFCPSLAMRFHPDTDTPFQCTVCGICVKSCPTGALSVVKEDEAFSHQNPNEKTY